MNTSAAQGAASHLAPLAALPAGTRLQEFEIKSVIGEGGFGIVYCAHDTLLGREVAIKEYLPVSHATRQADGSVVASSERQRQTFEKALRSFVSEARMLARFKHPALVEILRFWEAQGTAYMVMPYYQGRSLHALIQEGFRFTDSASLEGFLAPLLDGLAQLHSVNCYHRDISSDNILILENGQPLLLDFGAARSLLIDEAQAATVILKPGFAPIEQYSEDASIAPQGPWTDLYALSAVAYQAITGMMPAVSVARIIRDPLTPLADIAPPGIVRSLLTAIDLGLRVAPGERPQSVQAFCQLMGTLALDKTKPLQPPVVTQALKQTLGASSPETRQIQAHAAKTVLFQEALESVPAAPQQKGKQRMLLLGLLLILALLGALYWGLLLRHDEPEQPVQDEEAASLSEQVAEPTLPDESITFAEEDPASEKQATETETETEFFDQPPIQDEGFIDNPWFDEVPLEVDKPIIAPEQDFEIPTQPWYPPENVQQEAGIDSPRERVNEPPKQTPKTQPLRPQAPPPVIKPPRIPQVTPEKPKEPALPKKATVHVCADPAGDIYVNGELRAASSRRFQFQAEPGALALEVEIRYPSLATKKFAPFGGIVEAGVIYRFNKQECPSD